MSNILHDLRYTVRKLRKNPGFAVVAVATLALGIGASTAIFSVVDAALLRALPFENPARLTVILGVAGPDRDVRYGSYPEVGDWRAMTRSFVAVSIYNETTLNLSGMGAAEMLEAEIVSPGYFRLLGVSPQLGRGLLPEDDVPGGMAAVVISHGLWQRRFDGAHDILGRTVVLDDRQAVVVGVMPEGFQGLSFDTQVWATLLPFEPDAANDRGSRWLAAIGRLRPRVSMDAAQADLWNTARQLEDQYPDNNRERSADLVTLHEFYLGTTQTLLLVVLGAVGFLMLIACVNVINLQIMRGIGRRAEVALRYALGAGRRRLVRQFTTEAAVLAFLGGIAGVVIAWLGMNSLIALVPAGVLPGYVDASINGRVMLFAAGIIALTGMLSGVVPALRGTRQGLADDLRAPNSGTAAARAGTGALQRVLVAVEVGLAVALIGGAALMVRSLTEQLAVAPGFQSNNVLAAGVNLTSDEYSGEARVRFATQLIGELQALTGVASVAIGSDAPLRGNSSASMLVAEGRPDERIRYYRHNVTPEYFGTLGIAMIRGRSFDPSDDADAPGVVVVSAAFAEKLWPGRDAIGQYIQIGLDADEDRATVIGVAENVRFRDLTTDLFSAGEDPDVYFSYAQIPTASFEILVRSATSELTAFDVVRRAVTELDPSVPLGRVQPLESVLEAQTASARFGSVILGLFAVLALVLCGIGLYGIMAFFVASRRSEIAVRMALGARQTRVLGMVVRQGMLLVGAGAIAGLAAVLLGGRLFSSLFFSVGATDPAVHLTSVGLLAVIAFVACALPAWRATRIDPTEALRSE
ncbi:MAG: ABC transporter permease [Woeseiaceae bacterium]